MRNNIYYHNHILGEIRCVVIAVIHVNVKIVSVRNKL